MINTIVTDIDGTLVKSGGILNSAEAKVLISFQEKGGRVILLTARNLENCKDFINGLKLKEYEGYIIFDNGYGIYQACEEHVIYKKELSKRDVDELTQIYKKKGKILVCGKKAHYHPYSKWAFLKQVYSKIKHSKHYFTRGSKISYESNDDIRKMQVHISRDVSVDWVESKIEVLKNKYSIFYNFDDSCVEITSLNVSKYESLKTVLNEIQVDHDACVAFGNDSIDNEVLKNFKHSGAVKNSNQKTKECANFLIDVPEQHGLIKKIDELEKNGEMI